ncbi:hypothetical protein BH09PSE5_BH09PSE5_20200 [soil metagenome]
MASSVSAFEACTQLSNRFFHCMDEQRYSDMLAMMVPDAVWHRQGKRLAGHDQIRAALNERSTSQRIRHVLTNGFVEREDSEGADYVAYMIGYKYDDGTTRQPPLTISGPMRMLLLNTRFVRRLDGDWLIQETSAIPEFEFANNDAAGKR